MATDKVGSGDAALSSMYAQMRQMGATGAGFAGVIMDTEKKTDPNAVVGKQSLVVEKDGVFYALGGKKPLKLESKDPEAAKEEARTKIKEGSLSDLAALSFDNITKKKMAGSQDGGAGSETPPTGTATTGADGKPAAEAAPDPVAVQAKIAKLFAENPKNVKEITLPDGTKAKILVGNKMAIDQSGKQLPLKSAMTPEQINAEDQAIIDAAVKQGFGVIPAPVSGPVDQPNVNTAGVQQGAPTPEVPAGVPPAATPTSVPGRAGNGANYNGDPAATEGGTAPEGGASPEGGVMPTAAPVTGQPAQVGA
jgi:hypothetical protein